MCSADRSVQSKHLTVVQVHHELCAPTVTPSPFPAASFGHAGVIKALIEDGQVDPSRAHAFAGSTALHFAAEIGSAEVVSVLCSTNPMLAMLRSSSGGQVGWAGWT